ncbi:MAG: DUF983 domain-containing protein [Phaeodactylibacter sp.]|uniref:DUF983 domain-containing protein n=1 Tax=Phaeodactylibacter sp. TaxID=1940289 RepID=UPI0032EC8502
MKLSWKRIWNYKCPRCGEGDMFKKPFNWTNPIDMHNRCEKCGLDFEPEPGFYFGALIISYGISSWMLLLPALLLVLYYDWSVMAAMGFTLAFAGLTYFKIMRLSRSLYLHFSMRYDKSLEKSDNSSSKYDKTIF